MVSSFGSVVVVVFLAASLLVLWQIAIALGAVIGHLSRRGEEKRERPARV
jgi:hypothetical protein